MLKIFEELNVENLNLSDRNVEYSVKVDLLQIKVNDKEKNLQEKIYF